MFLLVCVECLTQPSPNHSAEKFYALRAVAGDGSSAGGS